jgi:hypothetical protein
LSSFFETLFQGLAWYDEGFAAMSYDPTHLTQLERLLEGLRKAGLPEE